MKLNFNLVQRFLSDTPTFWKFVDLFGVILMAVAGILADQHLLDLPHATLLGSIGAALTGIAKFTTKTEQMLKDTGGDPYKIKSQLPGLIQDSGAIIKNIRDDIQQFKDSRSGQKGQ